MENNADVKRTDEVAAEKFDISATTMRIEIAIADNKDLLDPKGFADWDEGKGKKKGKRRRVLLMNESN